MGYDVLGKTLNVGLNGETQPASGATFVMYDSTRSATQKGAVSSSNAGARFKCIIVNIESSHDSATDGLEISESDDNGAEWNTIYLKSYVAATDLRFKRIEANISAPDIRVRYINSANTLTKFKWAVLGDPTERAV